MKKFTFKTVLDGFRSSVNTSQGSGSGGGSGGGAGGSGADRSYPVHEIVENLRSDNFNVTKTFCHGFPFQPSALAFDPVQKLIAIGTQCGSMRILGRPGVDIHLESIVPPAAVLHLEFLVNEGKLVGATSDDVLHLWNFRENKKPEITHSLKFQRERITCLKIPLQSKWIYIGTERGNIHVVNLDTFQLSGYIINWNKAIELSRKTHPGCVVYLGDNPTDSSKLLIAYDSGQMVLWDLRLKAAEIRFQSNEPLRSVAWHSDGKSFVSSHTDGSLLTWTTRINKPVNASFPHARGSKDGKAELFRPISKVDWKSSRSGDNYVIFSGGLPAATSAENHCPTAPSLTVIHGKTTTVLEMEHNVLDFIVICESQWESEIQDPAAIIVLLQSDLVIIDLHTPGYPCFPNPYPMDIHESPVTTCVYIANCPGDLIPALYSVGSKVIKKAGGYSDREWPVNGGSWGSGSCSYAEIVVTGHADGSVKFWDASSTSLQALYKLKTSKAFERTPSKKTDDSDPYAVQLIKLCPDSRMLLVAGASSQVLLFKFRKHESVGEMSVLEIPIVSDLVEDEFGGFDYSQRVDRDKLEFFSLLRVKSGSVKKPAGFQVELVCLTPWVNGDPPGGICSLALASGNGLLGYGTETGVVVVDYIQKVCLLSNATPDLYGTADPYTRAPKSPSSLKRDESPPDSQQEPPMSPTQLMFSASASLSNPSGGGGSGGGPGGGGGNSSNASSSTGAGAGGGSSSGGGGGVGANRPGDRSPRKQSEPRRSKSQDKLDSTFSRSRSSSMSSLDNISSESIPCLSFVETFPKKNDASYTSPTVWVGTSLGSILVLNIGSTGSDRQNDPLTVTPSGTIFRLKGSILEMCFLDANGAPICGNTESWRDEGSRAKTPTKPSSRGSPTDPSLNAPLHYAILVSEKQSRVVSLPSQICLYKAQLVNSNNSASEQSSSTSTAQQQQQPQPSASSSASYFVIRAGLTTIKDSPCLVTYNSNGRLSVYSLPSLRILIDVEFVPLSDLSFLLNQSSSGVLGGTSGPGGPRKSGLLVDPMLSIWGQQIIIGEDTNLIAKTFCFSEFGHGLYLSSPSEIQKFTISAEFAQSVAPMFGSLYIEAEFPERPKESFLMGLFGVGVRNLDREELFGEASGKPPRSVAKLLPTHGTPPALEHLAMRQSTAASEVQRARMLLVERGEKLGHLEERTAKMATDAENFSSAAHQLMLKYKDKKWYQL